MNDYFLATRIKPPAAGDEKARAVYLRNVSILHEMIVQVRLCREGNAEACKKLGIEFRLDEEVTLFDRSVHRGMTARLPGWRYPVVFKDGKLGGIL